MLKIKKKLPLKLLASEFVKSIRALQPNTLAEQSWIYLFIAIREDTHIWETVRCPNRKVLKWLHIGTGVVRWFGASSKSAGSPWFSDWVTAILILKERGQAMIVKKPELLRLARMWGFLCLMLWSCFRQDDKAVLFLSLHCIQRQICPKLVLCRDC